MRLDSDWSEHQALMDELGGGSGGALPGRAPRWTWPSDGLRAVSEGMLSRQISQNPVLALLAGSSAEMMGCTRSRTALRGRARGRDGETRRQ